MRERRLLLRLVALSARDGRQRRRRRRRVATRGDALPRDAVRTGLRSRFLAFGPSATLRTRSTRIRLFSKGSSHTSGAACRPPALPDIDSVDSIVFRTAYTTHLLARDDCFSRDRAIFSSTIFAGKRQFSLTRSSSTDARVFLKTRSNSHRRLDNLASRRDGVGRVFLKRRSTARRRDST